MLVLTQCSPAQLADSQRLRISGAKLVISRHLAKILALFLFSFFSRMALSAGVAFRVGQATCGLGVPARWHEKISPKVAFSHINGLLASYICGDDYWNHGFVVFLNMIALILGRVAQWVHIMRSTLIRLCKYEQCGKWFRPGIKKRNWLPSRQPIFVNLKSNTMKNTLQM